MTAPGKALSRLLLHLSKGSMEVTLAELFETLGLDDSSPLLERLVDLQQKLRELGLKLTPDFDQGTVQSPRCIDFDNKSFSPESAALEIEKGESDELEFKSSLYFDYSKFKANPGLAISELRSELVTQSALKTIAAFLNSQGGILYVGIDDGKKVLGIEQDLLVLKSKKKEDPDAWQLSLLDLLLGRFKDGDSIGCYIQVRFVLLEGKLVARIEVTSRRKLSFLKGKDGWLLFRRDGNRTLEVKIDQVQEFLDLRYAQQTIDATGLQS